MYVCVYLLREGTRWDLYVCAERALGQRAAKLEQQQAVETEVRHMRIVPYLIFPGAGTEKLRKSKWES